jgi:hypothetical protein
VEVGGRRLEVGGWRLKKVYLFVIFIGWRAEPLDHPLGLPPTLLTQSYRSRRLQLPAWSLVGKRQPRITVGSPPLLR